jgi:hypothetical protein
MYATDTCLLGYAAFRLPWVISQTLHGPNSEGVISLQFIANA